MTVNGIQRIFPNAAPKLKISTDGEYLILENVETDEGKLYNVKFICRDAKGDLIGVKEEDQFSVMMLQEIMELSKKLLKPGVFEEFRGKTLWLSTDGDKFNCFEKDIDDKDEIPEKGRIVTNEKIEDISKQDTAVQLMYRIHEAFFKNLYGGDTTKLISPTYTPATREEPIKPKRLEEDSEEPKASTSPSSSEAPKKAKAAKAPAPKKTVPDEILKYMPKPIQDKEKAGQTPSTAPSSASPSATASGATLPAGSPPPIPANSDQVPAAVDYQDELLKEIDRPTGQQYSGDANIKKPVSLQDLTYKMLRDYSLTKKKQPSDPEYIDQYYESFKRLLRKPDSDFANDQVDDKEMFQWLQHYFGQAYNFHKNHRDQLEGIFNANSDEDFNDLCVDYAASAVAGFILTDIPGVDLIEAIKKASTLSVY